VRQAHARGSLTAGARDARNQETNVLDARRIPDATRVSLGGPFPSISGLVSGEGATTTGITIELPDELAALLAEEAARRSVSPEELAARTLADSIPKRPQDAPAASRVPTSPPADVRLVHPSDSGERKHPPARPAARLMVDLPATAWIALFLLAYAAIFLLIVVVIVKALA
jgi:hypothetical protein